MTATKYPWVGKIIKVGKGDQDSYMVSFTAKDTGTVISSTQRSGPTATGTQGTFKESDFKKLWQ